jgi:hypothetical protein
MKAEDERMAQLPAMAQSKEPRMREIAGNALDPVPLVHAPSDQGLSASTISTHEQGNDQDQRS